MLKKRSGYKLVSLCQTSDNFHPNIAGDKVEVSLYIGKNCRIAVWGDDDFGMGKSGYTSRESALSEYRKITSRNDITKEYLKGLGFTNE